MVGIRFHGRGGQGAVIASKILANAYFKQGFYVQAFPSFGMERKGAAVSAFVRIDGVPIVERGEIRDPSAVIVLDSTLLGRVDVTQGVRPGARILLNCRQIETMAPIEGSYLVAGVDAVKIALEHGLGTKTAPTINTVILGAYAQLAGDLSIENLLEAIEAGVPDNQNKNMAAAEAAYHSIFRISGDFDAT